MTFTCVCVCVCVCVCSWHLHVLSFIQLQILIKAIYTWVIKQLILKKYTIKCVCVWIC